MIHYLLLYQFPFLYCVSIALGLVVYGSDFDELAGKLYLIPLLVLPVLHWFVGKLLRPMTSLVASSIILLAGAMVALFAYQKLHFAFWDEHSLTQTIALVVLGVFSYLSSVLASIRLHGWGGDHRRASSGAWLVLGLCWLLAFYFPMSALFVIAAILAASSIWHVVSSNELRLVQYKKIPLLRPVKYLVFVLAMDLGLVLWDYQVNTGWAWHLGGAFIAAAFGSWLAFNATNKNYWPIVVIAAVTFITAIIWPAFVLHYLHSAIVGLCLGWGITSLMNAGANFSPITVVSSAMPVFLGLAFGNLFYSNLAHVYWRVVLLLPLLVMLFMSYRKTDGEIDTQGY